MSAPHAHAAAHPALFPLVRRMWQRAGMVVRERGAQTLMVLPRGDRRKRPIGWIDAAVAAEWLEAGVLELEADRGLRLSHTVVDRLRRGQSPADVLQALLAPPQPAARSVTLPPVETFDKLCNANGVRVFTDAQVEAARRFRRDLVRAGQTSDAHGGPSTSDVAVPQVDGGLRHGRAEDAMIRRVDAGRAVHRAKRGLDGRVSRVLTTVIARDTPVDALDGTHGWSEGVGAMLMQIGLDHLVRHYGVRSRP